MEPGAKVAKPVVVLVPGRDRDPEETRAGAAETAAKAMVAETAFLVSPSRYMGCLFSSS